MSAIDAKVNMSLADIIKMEKKKKPAAKKGQGRRQSRGARGGGKGARGGAQRRSRSRVRGNANSNNAQNPGGKKRARSASNARRGKGANANGMQKQGLRVNAQKFGVRTGFVQKKKINNNRRNMRVALQRNQNNLPMNNGNRNQKNQNIRNVNMRNQNRNNLKTLNVRNQNIRTQNFRNQPLNQNRAGLAVRNNRSRSRSRSRVRNNQINNQNQIGLVSKNKGMNRSNSLSNIQDPLSVHNRLGYQNPKQLAYRNRVKRAKLLLLQKQNKGLVTKRNPIKKPRRNSVINPVAALRADQLLRNQQRLQYENKLLRMNLPQNYPTNVAAINAMNYIPDANQLVYLEQSMRMANQRSRQRGRSPFRQNMINRGNNNIVGGRLRARSRSRSRSRPRQHLGYGNPNLMSNNVEDRSFSEVMYSLQGNYGITGRTLNDRFSY